MIIDKLAYSSAIRSKSPFLKSGFAVGALLICVGFGAFLPSAVILLMMMTLTLKLSRTNAKHYKNLMVAPFAFLLMGTAALLFDVAKEPMGIVSFHLGSVYIVVLFERIIYVLRLMLVSISAVSCLYFLILTTPITDLFLVLRKLHCPNLIIELMMMTYRYIFVLFEMAIAISTAQSCRLSNINAKSAIKAFGGMLSTVFFQAMQRANFLFDAMESRCYDGELRVLEEYTKATASEKITVLATLAVLIVIAIANVYFKIWI